MSIQVKNLLKIYGQQRAVNNVSFTIEKGEMVGFLGPNGAGKSTTMKMIAGYTTPTKGDAYINEIDIRENPVKAKKQLGYLPEKNPLYAHMYVMEYLQFVARVFQMKNANRRIDDLLDIVGLRQEEAKKIEQLSKGYKQRLGLAGSILHNPSVLVLDEATSGLDPNQAVVFRNLIREIAQEKAVLFSSHILADVESLCKRVIIINQGTIVADDTLENLKKKFAISSRTIVIEHSSSVKMTKIAAHIHGIEVRIISDKETHIMAALTPKLNQEIIYFMQQQNIDLVSIQQKNADLENLFRQLTTFENRT